MAKTYRNSQYNQQANVGMPQNAIQDLRQSIQDLRQLQNSGGNFTRLAVDPSSLGGLAGSSIIQAQALEKTSNLINKTADNILSQTMTQNARNFQSEMFNSIIELDQKLHNVKNTDEHRELYTETINKLKDGMGGFTLLSQDNRFKFENHLKQVEDRYNEKNRLLNIENEAKSLDIADDTINNYTNSVPSSFSEQASMLENHATDRYQTLINAGQDEDKVKTDVKKTLLKQIIVATNSVANPKMAEDYYNNLNVKNEDGEFKYFKEIQGKDRAELQDQIKSIASKSRYGNYNLTIAKDIPLSNKVIEKDTFLDSYTKSILINRNNALIDSQKRSTHQQVIKNDSFDYKSTPEQVENYLGSEYFKKTIGEQAPAVSNEIRAGHFKEREKFRKDPVGTLKEDPDNFSLDRKELINLQAVYGLKDADIEIFSQAEKNQFSQIVNNTTSIEEKLAILNFQHPTTKGFLESLNFKDLNKMSDFVNKNKSNLISSIETLHPTDKTAFSILSFNNDNPKAIQVAKKLLAVSLDDKINNSIVKNSVRTAETMMFKQNKLIKYLLSHEKTKETGKTYLDAFKNSDISRTDFLKMIPLEPIEDDKFDLIYNKNDFKRGYIKDTLNKLVDEGMHFDPLMQKDKDLFHKIQRYGKWENEKENFVYNYKGVPLLYAIIKDDEVNKEKKLEPQLAWKK